MNGNPAGRWDGITSSISDGMSSSICDGIKSLSKSVAGMLILIKSAFVNPRTARKNFPLIIRRQMRCGGSAAYDLDDYQ